MSTGAAVVAASFTALVTLARMDLAEAQSLPPGPTFPIQSTFEGVAPTGPYEQVQLVLDFPPGAWTPNHSHGGQVFVTVLSGEITIRGDSGDQIYRVGDRWTEGPGELHRVGNTTGENARVVAALLLPAGSALTTVEDQTPTDQLPPGPTLVYQTRANGASLTGPVDVTQLVGEFAPGAWTPRHEHGGLGLVTVLDGQVAVRDAAGERTFGPGESWVEGPGEVAAVGNPGTSGSRVVASFVLADGAMLTTVRDSTIQIPARLPATGAADSLWVAGALGLALLAAGLGLRRRTA